MKDTFEDELRAANVPPRVARKIDELETKLEKLEKALKHLESQLENLSAWAAFQEYYIID